MDSSYFIDLREGGEGGGRVGVLSPPCVSSNVVRTVRIIYCFMMLIVYCIAAS